MGALRVVLSAASTPRPIAPKASHSRLDIKVRPARFPLGGGPDPAPAIAACFAKAFGPAPFGSAPSDEGGGKTGIDGLFVATGRGGSDFWQQQVSRALLSKQAAAVQSREHRLGWRDAGRSRRYNAAERQQAARWRRQRSFVVLVAEERGSGELLGCAAISLAQPEAVLPPPFPTSKPRRVYVSNIAVPFEHRRQGVGTALLNRCERQARLWRQDSLWLHVELSNKPALLLYERQGYTEVARDPMFTPNRRCLMRKPVEPLQCSSSRGGSGAWAGTGGRRGTAGGGGGQAESSSSSSNSGGGSNGSGKSAASSGVFVWSDVDLLQDPERQETEQQETEQEAGAAAGEAQPGTSQRPPPSP